MILETDVMTGLSTRQAAAYLGLSERTLANWRCYGQGPVYSHLGRLVRYERDALDSFIEQLRKDPFLTSAARRRPPRSPAPAPQCAPLLDQAPETQPPSTPSQRLPEMLKALSLGAALAQERLDHEKTRKELKLGQDELIAVQQELTKLQVQLQAAMVANRALNRDKAQIQSQHQEVLLGLETATKANESLKAHVVQLQTQRDEAIGRQAQAPDVSALHRTIEELKGMLASNRTASLVFDLMTANAEDLGLWYLQNVNPKGRPDLLDTEKMRRRCLHQIGFKVIKGRLMPDIT